MCWTSLYHRIFKIDSPARSLMQFLLARYITYGTTVPGILLERVVSIGESPLKCVFRKCGHKEFILKDGIGGHVDSIRQLSHSRNYSMLIVTLMKMLCFASLRRLCKYIDIFLCYRQIRPICTDMLPTSAWCRPYRQIWPICPICCRRRPDVGHIGRYSRSVPIFWPIIADILPTSAWCRPYRQVWPICADMLPTSASCRPYRQIWPTCPDMLPTSAWLSAISANMADLSRYAADVGHIGKYGRFARYAADVGLMSAISADIADQCRSSGRLLPRFCRRRLCVGHIGKYGRFAPICCRRRPGVGHIGKYDRFAPTWPIWPINADLLSDLCRYSADVCLVSAISANMTDFHRYMLPTSARCRPYGWNFWQVSNCWKSLHILSIADNLKTVDLTVF